MDRKYLRNLVNIVLFLVGVVLVCLLVPRLVIFFMPFVVGWIIALIANPLVRLMEKRLKIVRKHSSALIIVGTIALIVLGGYGILSWLVREIYGFIGVLPDLYEALLGDLETTSVNLAGISEKIPPELLEKLSATVHSLTESLGKCDQHHRRAYSGGCRKYREKYPQYPGACDIHHPVRLLFHRGAGQNHPVGQRAHAGGAALQMAFHHGKVPECRGRLL